MGVDNFVVIRGRDVPSFNVRIVTVRHPRGYCWSKALRCGLLSRFRITSHGEDFVGVPVGLCLNYDTVTGVKFSKVIEGGPFSDSVPGDCEVARFSRHLGVIVVSGSCKQVFIGGTLNDREGKVRSETGDVDFCERFSECRNVCSSGVFVAGEEGFYLFFFDVLFLSRCNVSPVGFVDEYVNEYEGGDKK